MFLRFSVIKPHFYLSMHQLVDSYIVSDLGLLWIMMLWLFMYKSLTCWFFITDLQQFCWTLISLNNVAFSDFLHRQLYHLTYNDSFVFFFLIFSVHVLSFLNYVGSLVHCSNRNKISTTEHPHIPDLKGYGFNSEA